MFLETPEGTDYLIERIVERFCSYFQDKDPEIVLKAIRNYHFNRSPLDLRAIYNIKDRGRFARTILVMVNTVDPITGECLDNDYVPPYSLIHIKKCEDYKQMKKADSNRCKTKNFKS